MSSRDDIREQNAVIPVDPVQLNIWENMRQIGVEPPMPNPFGRDPQEEERRRRIAQHKLWMEMVPHECPSPYEHYRIGVYIRYFNQTKYGNYIQYHMQEFADTIALCPNWTLAGFYVDEGQSAPNMENAKEWCRLLQDCMDGKIDLILTQKVSNVSRKPAEVTFCARFLATQPKPIGIYFISEDIYTLASYYLEDMRERSFLPSADWKLLPDEADDTDEIESRGELNE